MGKLSSIEDVEAREREGAGAAAVPERRNPVPAATVPHAPEGSHAGQSPEAPRADAADASAAARARLQAQHAAGTGQPAMPTTADEEAAFHGLDDAGSLGIGHKALIIAAAVVFVAAVAYVLNYWLHFL